MTGPKDAGETAAGASNDPEKWNIPIETGVTGWLRKGPAAATRAAVSAGAGDNVAVVALTTRQIAPPLQVSSPRRGASPNRLRPGTRLVPAFAGTCRAHSEGSSLVDLVDVCAASFALEAVVPPTFYGWLGDNPAEVDPGDRDDLGLGRGSGFDEGGGGAGWAELDGWIDGFRRSGEGVPSTRAPSPRGMRLSTFPRGRSPPALRATDTKAPMFRLPSAAVARFLGAIGACPAPCTIADADNVVSDPPSERARFSRGGSSIRKGSLRGSMARATRRIESRKPWIRAQAYPRGSRRGRRLSRSTRGVLW